MSKEKKTLKVGKAYEFIKEASDQKPIKGIYVKMMRKTNGDRIAVFKKGAKTWWVPEKLWKHIKPLGKEV